MSIHSLMGVAVAVCLSMAPLAVLADKASMQPMDASICQDCDIRSAEDPRVKGFLETIAATRWQMAKTREGWVRIQSDEGEIATWRYTSVEGRLDNVELLGVENTVEVAPDSE